MPMQPNPNKRRGEERSETLIIPHITKEMVETARHMAEQGASRAEIEAAIAAMQAGKAPGTAAPQKPIVDPQPIQPAPQRNETAHHNTVITPTSRPRYTAAERRAMLEEVQRRQAEREAARRAEAQEEEGRFRVYRDQEYAAPQPAPKPAAPQKPAAPAPSHPAQAARPDVEATRTVQIPAAEVPAAPQPAPKPAAPVQPTAPAQPAAVPAHTQAEAAPAPKHTKKSSAARGYTEAENALNERIRADHIWLSNPVLVRGLGMAPVIGAALDGERALMLCIAALILVTFTRVLAVAVCHLTKNRFRPVVYCYSAALLYIPTYIFLYELFGSDLTLLGIYLPIMVVEPAGFNNALGMCVVLLIVGSLRELLATGAVFGNVLLHSAPLPLAALPAGGFVILGVMAACWCAAANLYTDYKHEEVRRLYADRKH